jgi:hypothetical protein
LTDTPEFYRVKESKDIPLRKDLKGYLVAREHSNINAFDYLLYSTYSAANINKEVQPEDVQFLSLFDIELTAKFTFESKNTSIGGNGEQSGPATNGVRDTATISRNRSNRRKQASTVYSPSRLQSYQKELFNRLNDSVCASPEVLVYIVTYWEQLVDLGTKHRIL